MTSLLRGFFMSDELPTESTGVKSFLHTLTWAFAFAFADALVLKHWVISGICLLVAIICHITAIYWDKIKLTLGPSLTALAENIARNRFYRWLSYSVVVIAILVSGGIRLYHTYRPAGQMEMSDSAATQPPVNPFPPDTCVHQIGDTKDIVGVTYVWIPEGTFVMGCSKGDGDCGLEETRREIRLTPFWMTQTEITRGQYKKFKPQDVSESDVIDDELPIVDMKWSNARAYCTLKGADLPTEAQWEYAARGGTTTARYGELKEIAWYRDNSSYTLHDVKQKMPNRYLLYDMLGNAAEWVKDWFDPKYREVRAREGKLEDNPHGPPHQYNRDYGRIVRGGSYLSVPKYVRVSNPHRLDPELGYGYVGFRCVQECRP
jgi:Sulfatase-modifying factor enzyme 1